MKRLLTLCLIALITGCAFAQEFTLTANGFVNSANAEQGFVVIETAGNQSDIYKKVRTYLYGVYRSPKDVLSEAEPDMITVNGIASDAVQKKAMGMVATSYDMNYTISIRFKDGRIRIDAPSFTLLDTSTGSKPIRLVLCGKSNGGLGSEIVNTIYNKKGELKAKYAKEQLESYFNSYIKALQKGLETSQTEDW